MVAEVFAGLSGFKTMLDIVKGLKDLNDAAARNAAVIELQEKIFTAREEQAALLEQVSALEKEVARLKAWEGEKERYQLTEVGDGVFANALKPGVENSEPAHLLCANCFQQGKKSLLQTTQELRSRHRVHICPACKSEFVFGYVPPPPRPEVTTRYDPHRRR